MSEVTTKTSTDRSPVTIWLVVLAAAAIGYVIYKNVPREDGPGPREHHAVGRTLPTIDLVPLAGGATKQDLRSLEGKVVLLNLWGPWCGYCLQELPELAELEEGYRDQSDFVMLALTSEGDDDDDLAKLNAQSSAALRRLGIDLPFYADPTRTTRQGMFLVLGELVFPTTLVLDRQGVIRGVWQGRGDVGQMSALVDELLAETNASGAEQKAAGQ